MTKLLHKIKPLLPVCLCCLFLLSCSDEPREAVSATGAKSSSGLEGAQTAAEPNDVIARVGDQTITFTEINTMMNSAAVVGLSMPELGSPERDMVRLTLLDKLISANLLYLDAIKQGFDKDPGYRNEMKNFTESVLAGLYRRKHRVGNIEVTEAEIQDFFDNNIAEGTEFTDEVRMSIEAMLRKKKFKQRVAETRGNLREDIDVAVDEEELDPGNDALRDDGVMVASIDGQPLLWGEVKFVLGGPANTDMSKRLTALNQFIDNRIMATKGRDAGLEQNPIYKARVNEFRKNHLITLYRTKLREEMEPTAEEIQTYHQENLDDIALLEMRKVQMVVVKTKEEAEDLKQRIDDGELTMFKAAADYSTTPDAKKNLGEIGWVAKGSGFDELDKVTFALGPDEVGGPVESPAGWHLVRVLDVREAAHQDIEVPATRKIVRQKMIDERLNEYAITLRENEFPVEVDQETLVNLAQQEADWYAKVKKERQLSPGELQAQIEKLRK